MKKIISAIVLLLTICSGTAWSQVDTADVVMKVILSRYSVRGYDSRPVEEDKVEKLLRAAMAAPTDMNLQPWHFVVLNTDEAKAAYAGEGPRSERIKKVPLIIVVCADTTRMQKGEKEDIWVMDLSAATENMLLAAHAMGLGAVWTTVYPVSKNVESVKEKLNLPGNLIPMDAVFVGYPPVRGSEPQKDASQRAVANNSAGAEQQKGAPGRAGHGPRKSGPKDKWDPAKISYGVFE